MISFERTQENLEVKPRRPFPTLLAASLMAISLGYFSLPLLGHWLVREDAIDQVDAIVVLTGRYPQRALEAAQLYKEGYAREVWLTRPLASKANELGETWRAGEDALNADVLRREGVPTESIRVLDTPIINTADELNAVDLGLSKNGDDSVIIVTNKAHTRRVYELWNKYHAADGKALIRAVTDDDFSPSSWWTTASTRVQGIHEILGMINVWAGMPVHPPMSLTSAGRENASNRSATEAVPAEKAAD